ncbi:MAG: hypothetical protein JWN70_1547 [Planctomycetaceae bacterium]|nr:hypothetical protein [Planctomycetaceae bacterium]
MSDTDDMTMPKAKARNYQIEGQEYAVSISGGKINADGDVPLRISIRAHYGHRSFCLVRGVTNRSFWHDYPNIEEMRKNAISLAPRQACDLIALAHRLGWNPVVSRSNFEFVATKETIQAVGGLGAWEAQQ